MIQIPEGTAIQHLRDSFSKGDVLFWENFPGREKLRDSYFVLLTGCVGDQFICARATAQTQHYFGATAERLANDIVLIKAGETQLFPKDTIIDLSLRDYFTVEELSKLLGSAIKRRGCLPADIIKRINDCVRNAVTISERDQKLILGC